MRQLSLPPPSNPFRFLFSFSAITLNQDTRTNHSLLDLQISGKPLLSTRGTSVTNSTTPTSPSVTIFQPGSGAPTLAGRSWTGYFAAGVSGGVVALFFLCIVSVWEEDIPRKIFALSEYFLFKDSIEIIVI